MEFAAKVIASTFQTALASEPLSENWLQLFLPWTLPASASASASSSAAGSASALQVELPAEIIAAIFPMLTQDLQIVWGCGDDPP